MSNTDHPFYRLAPFIQRYIYRHNWTELRDIQMEACRVLFERENHLILAAGTASGKTEAAFLPILTSLHEMPSTSVGVLYIGPTKALINDQFYRLEGLLEEADIPVWAWHGDVSATRKRRLIEHPRGVLQITPESLESLLQNRRTHLPALFGDLRFVVIDEIHIFMGSDRGRQVLCQLERLERIMAAPPRRVGLSATLGDYESAENWIQGNSPHPVETITDSGGGRVRLAIEQFYRNPSEEEDDYETYLFERTRERKKTLIFGNSRGAAEEVIGALRQMARRKHLPDIYHVHHGSIAVGLRESAETAMKTPDQPAVIAATTTLELGIDIGQLERVLQLETPFSVASFLQRLGRSGRRGDPAEMWFVIGEEVGIGQEMLPELLPWSLLQAIAIIQLYIEERWIEPIPPVQYPFSLLYHQTMSILATQGERTPAELARLVLTLSPFRAITQEHFRTLLLHLIATDHIERLENGNLIVGLAGEKVVRNFRFLAVFQEDMAYIVRDERGEIGRILSPPLTGERFALAGRAWEVIDFNEKQRVVFVRRVQGRAKPAWLGKGGEIHTRILQRMQQVLTETTVYPYLQANARIRLGVARDLAEKSLLDQKRLVPLGGDLYCYFGWLGTRPFETLLRCLAYVCEMDALPITLRSLRLPYYVVLRCPTGAATIEHALEQCFSRKWQPHLLVDNVTQREKYDRYVPEELLREGVAVDSVDLSFQAVKF